jgi:hypothetical protein
MSYSITDVKGSVIAIKETTLLESGRHRLTIMSNLTLESGIYFVNLNLNGIVFVKKLIVE